MRFMKHVFGHLQSTNEWVLMNVVADDNCHLNNKPLFVHGLVCLTSRLYDMQVPNKAERNFSELKADAKTRKK